MKTYLFTLFLLGLSMQSCTKGCLKCTSENKCTLCDTTTFYKSDGDSCSVADQPNCSWINLSGECLICTDGYWLNTTTKKCVVVETAKKVQNCASYSSTQTCSQCEAHHVIENAICKAVATQLTNCDEYQTMTTCSDCKDGYFVSSDQKSCESVPSVSNCNFLSRFECSSCSGNYILNRNLYLKSAFRTGSSIEKQAALNHVLLEKAGTKVNLNSSVCQETTVKNCSEFETFNTCKTCSSQYFLKEDKTCHAYPKPVLSNCLIYSSNTVCSQCNQGFYRVSATECKGVTAVEHCAEYSTTSNTTECVKCNAEFYKASSTSCAARTVSANSEIANCQTKSLDSDKCSLCNSGFVLSTGQDECSTSVSNCKTHQAYTKGSTPTCGTCVDGFYLSNSICTAGSDSNCVTYLNSGTCDICKNKWYHLGTVSCAEHSSISNCETYHNTIKNTCKTCDSTTFNFEIEKRCKLLTEIANCETYDHDENTASSATCSACKDQYYLTNNTTCTKIDVSNCKVGSSTTVCTNCMDDYVLFDTSGTKTCVKPHDYMIDQCETVATTGSTSTLKDVTCSDCKINALPIDYSDNYVCVSDSYLVDASTINLTSTTKIDHCIKYYNDAGTLKCRICASGKFLKHDYTECLDNCGSNPFKLMEISSTPFHVESYNVCITDTPANYNQEIIGIDKTDIEDEIVIKCKANKLPVVTAVIKTTALPTSNVNLNGSFGNWVQDIGTSNPQVSCPLDTAAVIAKVNNVDNVDGTALPLIGKCKYYYALTTATEFGCIKCDHGYHGIFSAASKDGYIQECTTMGSCDGSIEYKNVPGNLQQFFSCHKCNNSNQIPFLVYNFATGDIAIVSFLEYSLTAASNAWTGTGGHTVECLDVSTEANFKTAINAFSDTTVNLIANCALGLLSTGSTKTTGGVLTPFMYCAACKPGYKPQAAYTGLVAANMATECTAIDNCEANSNWLNACSSCKTGYAYKTGADDVIDYTTCVSQKDNGCFATTDTDKNCLFCKKGYVLNLDGVCVIINTPKCQTNKYVPYTTLLAAAAVNSGYLMWYNEQGPGCNECDSGYTAVQQKADYFTTKSCAASLFIQTNSSNFPDQKTGSSVSSKYIENCESYVVDSNILTTPKCQKCNANWVLRSDGSECIKLDNCETASNSGTQCIKCKVGFGLVSNVCQAGAISNCSTYNRETNDTTKVNCTKCNEGFYKTNTSKCEEGNVANCLLHKDGTANECTTCKTNYFLISKSKLSSASGSHDYCYRMDDTLNCKEVTISTSEIGGKFTCNECSQPFSVKESPVATENQTSCLPYNLISNCKTYNTGSSLASSSLLCSLCNTGFYLSNNGSKCVKRTVSPVGCKTYQSSQDLCSSCNDGNFLAADGKSCVVFPVGKIGCIQYSDTETCTACGADTWLDEGKCTPIVTDSKVTNCLYYSNSVTCSVCQPGNFLEGNVCVVLNVSNCLKVASKNACESCIPGYRLKVVQTNTSSTTNCESFSKPSCAVFDQSGENPCTQCNQNFYINSDGDCVAVTSVIAQCLINETVDTCKTCAKGFALSSDKKSCINSSVYDSNCGVVTMPEKMSCSRCNPGYYFKDSNCVAFSGKSISSGCFSQDIDDEKVCLLCNTGYYMNSSLNCVKIDTTPVDPVNPVDPDSNNIRIIRSLIAMIVSLIFLF